MLAAEMPLKSPVNIPTAASQDSVSRVDRLAGSLQPCFQCGRPSELSSSGALGGLRPEVPKAKPNTNISGVHRPNPVASCKAEGQQARMEWRLGNEKSLGEGGRII